MTLVNKILIFSLIVISFAWLGLAFLINSKEGTKTVEIKVYGNLVEKLTLTEMLKVFTALSLQKTLVI